MKYQDYASGKAADGSHRTVSRRDQDWDRSAGLDMNLQSHLGRRLKSVYEPQLDTDLPQDISDLLKQLESIPTGASRGRHT